MTNTDLEMRLRGFSLATARVIYRLPDYKDILQEFIWQRYDIAPEFPHLMKFLNFWEEHIEGPIHSVTIAHQKLIHPSEIRKIDGEFVIN